MVKPPTRKAPPKKESIAPPKKAALKDASAQLRLGHPSAGRAMADESVAQRQGVIPKKAAPKRKK